MTVRLLDATRNAGVDAMLALANAGGAGSIQIRSGTQPATAGTAASGALLVTIPLANPGFTAASAGTGVVASTPRTATGVANGTAGWFRVLSGGGATVFDGSVTATGGGGDLTLATTTVSIGLEVNVTGGGLTIPSGN